MSQRRGVAIALLVAVALVLQVSVFSHLAWRGLVPDLVLLVVVAAAFAHGSEFAMVTGFAAGLLLDLAPPAAHVAGRWALALVAVGYVAGRARPGRAGRPTVPVAAATVAACSLVGTSVFGLTGLAMRDHAAGVPDLLQASAAAVVWDVALALVVLPLALAVLARAEPDRALA